MHNEMGSKVNRMELNDPKYNRLWGCGCGPDADVRIAVYVHLWLIYIRCYEIFETPGPNNNSNMGTPEKLHAAQSELHFYTVNCYSLNIWFDSGTMEFSCLFTMLIFLHIGYHFSLMVWLSNWIKRSVVAWENWSLMTRSTGISKSTHSLWDIALPSKLRQSSLHITCFISSTRVLR